MCSCCFKAADCKVMEGAMADPTAAEKDLWNTITARIKAKETGREYRLDVGALAAGDR